MKADIAPVLSDGLRRAYGANIKFVPYFSAPESDSVTIKIRIDTLRSDFGIRVVSIPVLRASWATASIAATDGWITVASSASIYSQTLSSDFSAEGRWVGTSALALDVTDRTNGRQVTFSIPLVCERDEQNLWGYRTAKAVSQKAWDATHAQLFRLIDDVVGKLIGDTTPHAPASSAVFRR